MVCRYGHPRRRQRKFRNGPRPDDANAGPPIRPFRRPAHEDLDYPRAHWLRRKLDGPEPPAAYMVLDDLADLDENRPGFAPDGPAAGSTDLSGDAENVPTGLIGPAAA